MASQGGTRVQKGAYGFVSKSVTPKIVVFLLVSLNQTEKGTLKNTQASGFLCFNYQLNDWVVLVGPC